MYFDESESETVNESVKAISYRSLREFLQVATWIADLLSGEARKETNRRLYPTVLMNR